MKVFNYLINFFNNDGEVIDNMLLPITLRDSIDRNMIEIEEEIDNSFYISENDEYKQKRMFKLFHKHNQSDIFVSFSYNFDVKSYLDNLGFNTNEYYIFSHDLKRFLKKNIVFYGGRGGEYFVLEDDEEFEILTSNGTYFVFDDITVIRNHGTYDIKGKLVFTAPATVHGYWKMRYNQEIVITKKLDKNKSKKYSIRKIGKDYIFLNKQKEIAIKLNSSSYYEDNYEYELISMRKAYIDKIRYDERKGKYYAKIPVYDDVYIWLTNKSKDNNTEYDLLKYINDLKLNNVYLLIRYKDKEDFKNKNVKIFILDDEEKYLDF